MRRSGTARRAAAPGGAQVERLGPAGLTARLVAGGLALAALLAGTVVGQDDAFPFGPFRMYSTSTQPDGWVTTVALEARLDGGQEWEPVRLSPGRVGLSRAEVEGRRAAFESEPELLGGLARAHARLRPDEPRWTALRLLRVRTVLADHRPTGEVQTRVLATWSP